MVVTCEVRGDDLTFGPLPTITTRLGIDQHPIDLEDADARAWLEAFVWPEQTTDLATLRAAIDLARAERAAQVAAGDATADTARLIDRLPGSEPAVVFTASLLTYLDPAARNEFVDQLDQAAYRRPVAWVFAEGPGLLATTDVAAASLDGPLAQRNSLYLVGVSRRSSDRDHDALLAWPTRTCAGSPPPAPPKTASPGPPHDPSQGSLMMVFEVAKPVDETSASLSPGADLKCPPV